VSSGCGPRLVGAAAHAAVVDRLRAGYLSLPPGSTVRLAKPTSNLFRPRERAASGLDVRGLVGVIAVDSQRRVADVQGMCTYETLLDATIPRGLMPLVVPQLRTIPLGGAVTGLGVESSSLRNGLPHESVLEMDILTGAGEVVTASAAENAELFAAFPNSYGSLGYAVRLRIALEPVGPFVALRHVRFCDVRDLVAAVEQIARNGKWEADPVAFVDGVVFNPAECYLTLGAWTDTGPGSDYTAARSITARSGSEARIGSACATISGAGIPTGFGARRLSAWSSRSCGGCGRGGIAVAMSTTGSSRCRTGTATPLRSTDGGASRHASGWCRMSNCRWNALPSSSIGSPAR
jgi:FAD/FMN-containing dehydrogenase